jgi:hypothetical protein
MVEQYSRFDLTKDVYAMLLVCSFFIWRFLLKNPNNFFWCYVAYVCTPGDSKVFCCFYWFESVSISYVKITLPQRILDTALYASRCDNVSSNVFVTYGYGLDANVKTQS